MTGVEDIAALERAHALFTGRPGVPANESPAELASLRLVSPGAVTGSSLSRYRDQATAANSRLSTTAGVDGRLASILQGAVDDHAAAERGTRILLDAARTDPVPAADTPMGQREYMARQAARLRAAHRLLTSNRGRALRRLALLRALHYHGMSPEALSRYGAGAPNPRAAIAVKAALSKLGCPYVWGATGPNQFDCSGLTQWAYKHAGIDITRTTYTQVAHGMAVPRGAIQPGDLVFPHAGHVQMYIGDGKVVEAQQSGVPVKISPMPQSVYAIRRPFAA